MPTDATAPVAFVDVGSNSVRLVVYEYMSRSPRPIFNEKSLCALGKGVATTGQLPKPASKALAALRASGLERYHGRVGPAVLATAAARDASNGAEFLAAAAKRSAPR